MVDAGDSKSPAARCAGSSPASGTISFLLVTISEKRNLYIAMRDDNYDLAIKAYKSWGFNDLSKDLIKVLNVWALYIYGPLLENKKRQIQDPNAKQNGKEVASNVYKELKKLGAIIEEGKDFIKITPPSKINDAVIDTYDDHRMAMCFSLTSLNNFFKKGGNITINDPDCVNKTFPNYFDYFL